MKNIFFLVSFILLSVTSFSQDVSDDIEVYLNNIIDDLPGSSGNDYQKPTTAELNTWGDMLDTIFNNKLEAANNLANTLNYKVVDFLDNTFQTNNRFYIIEEKEPRSKHWGVYVISKNPLRDKLIIQAPHPKYDTNTGDQAVFCFKRLLPKALFISGTHRCNHSEYSDCSGSTSVCGGGSSPYRISDNPHNTNSVFHRTTEKIFDKFDNTVFVQLHGFGKKESDPYVIMSNGTHVSPSTDYVTLIKNGLLQADPSLTFKIAHIDTDWYRLIAFSNVQGRYINKSSDPCAENASNSEGRFVHIEQERSKLRNDSLGWHKMYLALKSVFDITTNSVTLVSDNKHIKVFPNPNSGCFNVNLRNKGNVTIWNSQGICVFDKLTTASTLNIDIENQTSGIYLIRIISKNGIYQEKFLLMK